MSKPKFQAPDTYVIIFFVVLAAALLTFIVPIGSFETEEVTVEELDDTRTVIDPESFSYVTDDDGEKVREGISLFEPFGGVGFLNYMFEGMVAGDKWGAAVGVVAFILVIGGSFGIILKTGAVNAGILSMIEKTKGREVLLIPVLFFMFSLGGAIFGMSEEAMAFAMIVIPIVIAMGYDSIVGICITYVATQIGFATSWMNPFGVAIAQGVADVPVYSGAGFRMVLWTIFTAVGIAYTYSYARKIKEDPAKSIAYESDRIHHSDSIKEGQSQEKISEGFSLGHALVLTTIGLGIVWIIWGVVNHAYYIPEIATQFFTMGIISGIIGVIFKLNDMTINDIAGSFKDGAKDLVGAALVVGMAQGIILVLGGTDPENGTVLNTVLNWVGGAIGSFPAAISAWFMYLFQSIFNFFVVSGSGQAALVMPLMAPLADLAGVARQVAVLAYQMGDGFTNMIVPTSASLMGVLGVAGLDWSKWLKFIFKFQIILFVMASLAIITAVMIGLQ
ncbi:putative basic amino acid antiporter YfcC [Natranaerobius thermophilus]|uniref:C4-dicarboxylate anaerobic carrier n=1 Tax=Natranaerobius thermophilus (strain ATCC BAA-1301 / DSM 18059 / JW/NM-WN-LF) TaxID=457570 RepID=B2A0N1_NATTJ|nr:putative basic amino acid antiporter YfcC [Natranaerobius thermophilus]ACB84589.1 C4-dicarboxylate anaerobic carrier [Natranaerobius thermophilus JW/NM-WN-LF]